MVMVVMVARDAAVKGLWLRLRGWACCFKCSRSESHERREGGEGEGKMVCASGMR